MIGSILRRRSYGAPKFAAMSARSFATESTRSLGSELKDSFRKSSVQLLLVLVLGSTVLNIMKEKNFQEDVLRSFDWQKKALGELKQGLVSNEVGADDVREQLRKVNDRAEVLGLKGSYFEGIDYSVKDGSELSAKVLVRSGTSSTTEGPSKPPAKFL